MKPSHVAVVLGLAAAITSLPSQAGDRRDEARKPPRADSGMRAVAVNTANGQPGHGWRYFADARKGRAVVISPEGDYFYSRGDGLALVFKAGGTG